MNSRSGRQTGFTLIELLVVVVIIGVMAGIVMPRLVDTTVSTEIKATRAELRNLDTVLYTYRLEVGSFPTDDQGLRALIEDPGVDGWNGPYLVDRKTPRDAWDNPYIYRADARVGTDYDLYSWGPDRREGTDDDLYSAGAEIEGS